MICVTKTELTAAMVTQNLGCSSIVTLYGEGWQCSVIKIYAFEYFHNSHLIGRIQQNKIYKKLETWSGIEPGIACVTVRHINHYTRMFFVLVWGCYWFPFFAWVILSNLSNLSNWTKISSFWKKTRLCWCDDGTFCILSCFPGILNPDHFMYFETTEQHNERV